MLKNTRPYLLRKIIATLIDYIILFTITFLYMKEFGELNNEGGYTVNGLYSLPPILLWFAYLPMSETIFTKTFGHFIVGLKIVDLSGDNPNISQSIKRRLADVIEIFFFGIPAFIAIKKSDNNQRLGDLWADTIVIKEKDNRNDK